LPHDHPASSEPDPFTRDLGRAAKLRREVEVCQLPEKDTLEQLLKEAQERDCDMLILGAGDEVAAGNVVIDASAVTKRASCPVCVIVLPTIPHEVDK
jgi:hypothetical protein